MSIVFKSLESLQPDDPLPDVTGKEGEFLRVATDGTGQLEWQEIGGDGDFSCENCTFGDGTAAEPSITFKDDPDTGLFRPGTNAVAVSTGGVQRLDINGTDVQVGTVATPLDLTVRGNLTVAGNCQLGDASNDTITTSGLLRTANTILDTPGTYHIQFGTSGNGMARQTVGWSAIQAGLNAFNFAQTGSTCFTPLQIGLTNANSTNTKALTHNGPASFNTYNPTYSPILNNQTSSGKIKGSHWNIDCNQSTGTYIVGTGNSLAGDYRMLRSSPNNLTSWTELASETFLYGNMRHVAFGGGVWVVGTSASVAQNFFHSINDGLTWVQHANSSPLNTSRSFSRLRFINGQFIALSGVSESRIAFSNDGQNWSLQKITSTNYILTDIVYSQELRIYVISTASNAILYHEDPNNNKIVNGITFVEVTSNVYDSVDLGYSPKLGLFIQQSSTTNANWSASTDGKTWRTFTPNITTNNVQNTIQWCPDFGGFFFATQNATTNNVIVSRDGFNWAQVLLSIAGNSRSSYYNSTTKTFVFGLDANLTFKNASADFAAYVDRDAIYNTFNSNTRFADSIEYQIQNVVCAPGTNHFSPASFNRSVISVDTVDSNCNVYLQGASFNGRVGARYTIHKTLSTLHDVRIHGFETCNVVSPLGNIVGFNAQSSPNTYTLIGAGLYGSFDLTRIDDVNGGTWLIDKLNVFDAAGTVQPITGNLTVNGLIRTNNGTVSAPAYSFSSNTDTGMYLTSDLLGLRICVNSSDRITFLSTQAATYNVQMTGNVGFDAGSEVKPSIGVGGTNNTGIYSPALTEVAITCNGRQKMRVYTGLDIGTSTFLCDTNIYGNLIVRENSYAIFDRFRLKYDTNPLSSNFTLSSTNKATMFIQTASNSVTITLPNTIQEEHWILEKRSAANSLILTTSTGVVLQGTSHTNTITLLTGVKGHVNLHSSGQGFYYFDAHTW